MSDPFDTDLIESFEDAQRHAQITHVEQRIDMYASFVQKPGFMDRHFPKLVYVLIAISAVLAVLDVALGKWWAALIQVIVVGLQFNTLRMSKKTATRRQKNNDEWNTKRKEFEKQLQVIDPGNKRLVHLITEEP